MKKIIFLILLIMTISIGVSSVSAADDVTITHTMSLADIQAAFNNAAEFANIIFQTGDYTQILNLNISKTLNIVANDGVNIIGKGTGNAFNVLAGTTSFALSGFNISKFNYGVFGTSVNLDGVNITGNTMNVSSAGIYLYGDNPGTKITGVSNSNFSNNNITVNGNNGFGIALYGGNITDNTIDSNTINSTYSSTGYSSTGSIYLNTFSGDVKGNNITNNNLETDNGNFVYVYASKDDSKIEDNTISGNVGKSKNNAGIVVTNNANRGTVKNNKITNNDIESKSTAVSISGKGEISDNVVSDNAIKVTNGGKTTNYGDSGVIFTGNGKDTTIKSNKIYNNKISIPKPDQYTGYAIRITGQNLVEDNEIYDNVVNSIGGPDKTSGNVGIGLYASQSTNNKIYNNDINGFNCGIDVYDNVDILSNNITDSEYGIWISGENNKILSNNIINSMIGIFVDKYSNNTSINYNRIYKSSEFGLVNEGLNTNANLNWWGQNSIDTLINDTTNGKELTLDNWYVLKIIVNEYSTLTTGDKASFVEGTPVPVIISLVLNQDVENFKTMLPYFEINSFGVNTNANGDVRSTDLFDLIFGVAGEKYLVSAVADDAIVNFAIEFTKTPVPPLDPVKDNKTTDPKPGPRDDGEDDVNDDPNLHPAAGGSNSSSNSNSNSGSNTDLNNVSAGVSMKNTGIPIAILVAILFTVFSAVGIKRRK